MSRFVNLDNFPIDVSRYCPLQEMFQDDLSTGEEVAEGIAEALARLSWSVNFDGRYIHSLTKEASCI